MNNYIDFYYHNLKCILYNVLSIFFIITNCFVPLYVEETIYFNSKIIEYTTINYKFNSDKERNNFLNFMSKLIIKNEDLLVLLKKEKETIENLNNYELDKDNEYSSSDDEYEKSELTSDKYINYSSSEKLPNLVNIKSNSNNDILNNTITPTTFQLDFE